MKPSRLSIATVAAAPRWRDVPGNLKDVDAHLAAVARAAPGTELMLFPEANLTGYVLDAGDAARLAEPLDGPTVTALRGLAERHGVAVVAGLVEAGADGPHNTAVAVGPDGALLASYRKAHLFTASPEPEVYAPGERLALFTVGGWRCGLAICMDLRYPRLFEAYRAAGAEAVLMPFAWPVGRNKAGIFDALIRARAHECQMFVAGVNQSGADPNVSYEALSCVATPYAQDAPGHRRGLQHFATLERGDMEALRADLPLAPAWREAYRTA